MEPQDSGTAVKLPPTVDDESSAGSKVPVTVHVEPEQTKSPMPVLPLPAAPTEGPDTGLSLEDEPVNEVITPSEPGIFLPPSSSAASRLKVNSAQGATVSSPSEGNQFSPFRYNRRAFLTTCVAVIIILLIGFGSWLVAGRHGSGANSGSQANKAYSVGSNLDLGGVKGGQQLQIGEASQLTVNGKLLVSNTLVLTPTSTPQSPTAGQFYFDKSNNTPYFYNGTQFVSLAPQHVSSLGGASGTITLDSSLSVTNNQLGLSSRVLQQINNANANSSANSGPRVTSVQGETGDVVLNGGAGITINGTTISNSGVIGLTSGSPNLAVTNDGAGHYVVSETSSGGVTSISGTPNQVNVSSNTGNVTLSLPQDIAVTSSPTFGGLTVSGSLAVQGANSLSLGFPVGQTGTLKFFNAANGNSTTLQSGASASNLTFTLPSADGVSGACLMTDGFGVLSFQTCTGGPGGGVTSLDGQTGILTLGNSTGSAGVITIDNAKADAATKGIATFNATNFSDDGNGAINTIQDIAISSSPTFAGLTVNGTLGATNVNVTGQYQVGGVQISSSNLSDGTNLAKLNGTGPQVFTGNNKFTGTVVAQLTSPTAFQVQDSGGTSNLFVANTSTNRVGIGTLGPGYKLDVQGGDINTSGMYRVNGAQISSADLSNDSNLAKLNAGNLFTANNTFSSRVTIQGTNSLTLGTTSNLGAIIFQDGSTANTGTLQLGGALTGNATYVLPVTNGVTPLTGTQTLCTVESGNCAGSGSGITGSGTSNRLAKFNSSNSITDSSISDDGSVVTVATGAIIQGAAGLTLGDTGVNGQLVFKNSSNANTLTLQSGVMTGNLSLTLPTADGAANDCLKTDGSGVLTFAACTGGPGGGVTSLNTLTGVINLVGTANQIDVSTAGTTITLSLPQNINTGSNAIFRTVTLEGMAAGDNLIVANAVSGATGNLIDLKVNNVSKFTVDPNGNVNAVGQYQVGGVQISSSNLSDGTNLAKLNGTGPQVFTGNNKFTGTVLTQLDSPTAFQIQNGAGTSNLLVADTTTTRLGVGTNTPGYTLDVNGDVNTSGVYRINGVTICSAGGCTPSGGSGSYIQNGTSVQSANFYIQSPLTTSVGGIIQGALSQTADLFQLRNSGTGVLARFNSNGDLQVGGTAAANSTTALQVQNSSGSNLIVADTVNSKVGINTGALALNTNLSVYNGQPSTTQTDFTQNLSRAGINFVTDYVQDAYTGGLFWSTQNNNPTSPKAGIYTQVTNNGSKLLFGTSKSYSAGLTNTALTLGYNGEAIFRNSDDTSAGFQVQDHSGNGLLTVNTSTGATLTHSLYVDTLGSSGDTALCWDSVSLQISSCASSGSIGFWNRTGTTLQPANSGDSITTSGNISTTGSGTITSAGNINTSGGVYQIGGNTVLQVVGNNTFVGGAGNGSVTGTANTGVGLAALQSVSSGYSNSAFGQSSMAADVSGVYNASFGNSALRYNTSGNYNAVLGAGAGTGVSGGSDITGETLLGYSAGTALLTGGDYNTLLGYSAGANLTTGAHNIIIGDNVNAASATGSNQLNIGNLITGSTSNGQLAVGTSAVAAHGVLTVGTNTTTASGGLYFGSDTLANLYRSAPGQINTDGSLFVNGNVGVGGTYNTNTFNSNTLQFGAAGTATIDSASGQALQIGTGANAHNVTLGNTTGTSQVNIQGGSGNAGGDINIGNVTLASGARIVNIGATGSTTASTTINIGTSNSGTNSQSVTIGTNVAGNSTVLIQGGTTGSIGLQVGAGGTINVGTLTNNTLILGSGVTSGTIKIGGLNTTGILAVGQSTATNTITIGAAAGNGNTQTINIGTSSTAGSTTNITIGSTIAGTTTLQNATSIALNAPSIDTNATTVALLNATATTINFGGAASTLNIGPGGATATSINLAGGSAASGCTVDGATGNLSCTGNITGGATGTVGYWSRSGITLQPATAGDVVSSPGSGTSSERFGASASTSTFVSSLAVGNAATVTADNGTALGAGTSAGNKAVAVGQGATASGGSSLALGNNASATNTYSIALGNGANSGSSASIAIGRNASTTASNQLVIGATGAAIQNAYIGSGVTDISPTSITLQATGGSGANIAGASFTLAGGQGTGTGNGGNLNFQIASPSASSGSTLNALTTVASISGVNGSALFKNAANSTTAFQIQNTAGASLMNVDSTNSNITLLGNDSGAVGSWQTASNALPAVRNVATSVVANGYVYVIGGNNGSTPQSTVYYAKLNSDGSVGTWTTATNALPVTVYQATSVAANGYVYVMGGVGSSTVYYAKLNSDGSVGTWNTAANALPGNRQQATSVVANGYVYVIGGSNGTIQSTVYYAKLNSDGSVGAWNTASNALPGARSVASSVTANGYVYVLGGSSGTSQSTVYYAQLNSDGSVGTWNTATNALPGARIFATSVVANGYVYEIGGSNSSAVPQSTVYYAKLNSDGSVGTWNTAPNALPDARINATSVVSNGYIYELGGANGSGTVQSTVYYTSTPRLQVGGSLDLVGLQGSNLADGDSQGLGSVGGNLTAGDTNIVGTLQVQGAATFSQNVAVNGTLSVGNGVAVTGSVNVGTLFGNRLFSDGFESGNTSAWDTTPNNGTISTSTVYDGKYSIQVSPANNTSGEATYIAPNPTIYLSAWVNVSGQSSTPVLLMEGWSDLSGGSCIMVQRTSLGAISIYSCQTHTTVFTSSSGVLPLNAWHQLQLRETAGAGTGTTQVWVDSTLLTTLTSQQNGSGNINGIQVGSDTNSDTYTAYFDDVVADTSQITTPYAGLNVDDSLHVGGTSSFGNNVQIQTTSNSTTGFQVQNAAGSTIFNVDTAKGGVGIGTASIAGELTVNSTGATNADGIVILGQGSNTLNIYEDNNSARIDSINTKLVLNYGNGQGVQVGGNATSTAAFNVQGASGVSVLNVDTTNQRVQVGSSGTPTSQLFVSGSAPAAATGTVTPSASGLQDISVQGNYAYVIDYSSSLLKVVDISNPASPATVGSVSTNSKPQTMTVVGRYAYVGDDVAHRLDIIDVSNPTAPSLTGSLDITNGALSIAVSGKYAYVGAGSTIKVVDISNPAAPTLVSSFSVSTPLSMFVSGRYLYTVDNGATGTFRVIDISNPASLSTVGSVSTGGQSSCSGGSILGSNNIYASGRYVYVTVCSTNTVKIFDVSNPASPAAVGSGISTGSSTGPMAVNVQGRYAYVGLYTGNQFAIYDISTPSSPSLIGTTSNGASSGPLSLAIQGRYAYVADWLDSKLNIYNLGGSYIQQLETGSTQTGTLAVGGNSTFAGDVNTAGSIQVGQSAQIDGNLGVGGQALFKNTTNSTTAFQIQNSSGSGLFTADTSGMNIIMQSGYSGATSAWASTVATSLPAREGNSTVVANGYIYMLGGYNGGGQADVYYSKLNANGTTNGWTATTSLPNVADGNRAVFSNGYIYVLSGSSTQNVYYAKPNFDGTISSWTTLSGVLPAGQKNTAAVTANNGYIYWIGGDNGTATNTVVYAKQNPDGSLGTFTTTSQLGTGSTNKRTGIQAVIANGYVYIFGGYDDSGTAQKNVLRSQINTTTGALGAWSDIADNMPANRHQYAAALVNGYVYIMGGIQANSVNGAATNTVFYAHMNSDGSMGAWTTSTNTLPDNLRWVYATADNGYIYTVDGDDGSGAGSSPTSAVYYTSTSRVQVAGSLDLVGINGGNLADSGGNTGSTGGSLTAGDTNIVGALQVQGMTSFAQGVSITGTLAVGGDVVVKSAANSATAFQIQNSSGGQILVADASNTRLYIGNPTADSTGTLLVLDNKNTTGDPTAVTGGMYYNSATNSFRCAYSPDGGTTKLWESCGPQIRDLAADQSSTSATLADVTNMTFALAASTDYTITCNVMYSSASATNGINLAFNGPASPTSVIGYWSSFDNSTSGSLTDFQTIIINGYNAPNTATGNSLGVNSLMPGYLTATIRNGANAGNLALRFATKTGGTSVTVKAGTTCSLTQL